MWVGGCGFVCSCVKSFTNLSRLMLFIWYVWSWPADVNVWAVYTSVGIRVHAEPSGHIELWGQGWCPHNPCKEKAFGECFYRSFRRSPYYTVTCLMCACVCLMLMMNLLWLFISLSYSSAWQGLPNILTPHRYGPVSQSGWRKWPRGIPDGDLPWKQEVRIPDCRWEILDPDG